MINILICGDYCPRDRVADLIESENYKAVFGEIVHYTSQALNEIISNDKQLRIERERFMEQTKEIYLLSLEPYQNRYLRALHARNLLPSSISAERRLQLLNYLQCESHIERLLYSLQNNKKNDC